MSVSAPGGRSMALAIASENAPALLLIAGLPLNYYCQHGAWPKTVTLPTSDKIILSRVRHIKFSPQGLAYVATFELHSFIENDPFKVNWKMIIQPPKPVRGLQTIPLLLHANAFNIVVPFEYEYACTNEALS